MQSPIYAGAPGETRTPDPLLRRYAVQNSKCRFWCRLRGGASLISPLNWTELGLKVWGEPLGWHKLFGHSFRFHRRILASPSRRRGLGKGTAFESLSPEVLSKSSRCSLCSQKTPSLRVENKEPTRPLLPRGL